MAQTRDMRIYLFVGILFLLLAGCVRGPRQIVSEPLGPHSLQKDQQVCEEYGRKYGVINMEPEMAGNSRTEFPDQQRQNQMYESCMMKKGYHF